MDYSIIPDTSVIITTVVCIVVAILLLVVSFRIPMKWLSWLMRITTTATVSLLICFVVQIPNFRFDTLNPGHIRANSIPTTKPTPCMDSFSSSVHTAPPSRPWILEIELAFCYCLNYEIHEFLYPLTHSIMYISTVLPQGAIPSYRGMQDEEVVHANARQADVPAQLLDTNVH